MHAVMSSAISRRWNTLADKTLTFCVNGMSIVSDIVKRTHLLMALPIILH
jgi:hypothetical protein